MDFGTVIDAGFSSALGTTAIVYALASIGLNIQFGYTGLLNFGQAGFMVVGAFGLATSVVTWDIPFWPALVIALVAPMILAILLGVPTLRLRADYLAIATIATAEVLRFIIGSVEAKDVFGGSNGLTGYARTFKDLNPYDDGLSTSDCSRVFQSGAWIFRFASNFFVAYRQFNCRTIVSLFTGFIRFSFSG